MKCSCRIQKKGVYYGTYVLLGWAELAEKKAWKNKWWEITKISFCSLIGPFFGSTRSFPLLPLAVVLKILSSPCLLLPCAWYGPASAVCMADALCFCIFSVSFTVIHVIFYRTVLRLYFPTSQYPNFVQSPFVNGLELDKPSGQYSGMYRAELRSTAETKNFRNLVRIDGVDSLIISTQTGWIWNFDAQSEFHCNHTTW